MIEKIDIFQLRVFLIIMDAIWSARRYGDHFDLLANKGKQILKAASSKASSNSKNKKMKSNNNSNRYLAQEECLMGPQIHIGMNEDPDELNDPQHKQPLCPATIKKSQ